MAFVNPGFLYALALIAVPIIIHLLNFQRYKRVMFTNVSFLQVVKESTKARLKVRQWLILLARCLAIIFLVLAFAQPYQPKADNLLDQGAKLIYLDNSLSMATQDDEGVAPFDRGLQVAIDLHGVNPRMRNLVMGHGRDYRKVNLDDGVPTIQRDPYTLESIGPREIALLMTDRWEDQRDVVLLTDLQSPIFNDLTPLLMDSGHHYTLVPLSSGLLPNVYVDTVYLEEPVMVADQDVSLSVQFGYTGKDTYEDMNVKVLRDNNLVTTQTITLSPGAANLFKFDLRLGSGRQHAYTITLDDRPVIFDNRFHFVIPSQGKVRVAGIDMDNQFVKAVYADTALFEYSALSTSNMDINVLNAANLIILGEKALGSQGTAVRSRMEDGASVLLVPGEGTAWESNFREMGVSFQPITAGEAQEAVPRPGEVLQRPERESPFYSGVFEDVKENVAMPFARPTISIRGNGQAILKTRAGKEVLSKISRKNGSLYVFSTPLAAPYTDLQRHSTFVPTMYRLAFLSKTADRPLYHVPGQGLVSVEIDDYRPTDAAYRLIGENVELIPEQQVRAGRLLFRLPDVDLRPGIYGLYLDSTMVTQVAVNQSSTESLTNPLPAETLEAAAQAANIDLVQAGDLMSELDRRLERGGINFELWKYCILLCLLFLAAEILLIRFMK